MKSHKLIYHDSTEQKPGYNPITYFRNLSHDQKNISRSLFILDIGTAGNTIFSIEDIVNFIPGQIFFDKEILDTTCYLVARFIPSEILFN